MKQRDISRLQIYQALAQPDKLEIDNTKPDRFVLKKIYVIDGEGRKHLLLVFCKISFENNFLKIITVISASKIGKYFSF